MKTSRISASHPSSGLRVIAALVLAAPCLACLTPTGQELETQNASLEGELAGYAGDDEARLVRSREFYVELRSSGDTGRVMAGLSVDTGFSSLEPGEVVYEDGNGADVLGCAGPAGGGWLFDRHADTVTLTTEDVDEQTRRVQFEAVWDEGETLRGSFDYRVE